MGIGSIGTYGLYGYGSYASTGVGASTAAEAYASTGIAQSADVKESKPVVNPGESTELKPGRKSSPAECETCKNRKYQDGSDEMVSFKSAAHISPQASAATVRSHEQEHVSNAYKKAAQGNGKVISANVSLQTAVCPECGRTYTAGGTTTTQIKYSNESNPYQQNQKSADAAAVIGQNLNIAC